MAFFLKHKKNNPRNSEGSFVRLKDGRILFAYSRYSGDDCGDHSPADIGAYVSGDNGKKWKKMQDLVKNKSMNVMSVSLLRLQDGRIAMLYLEKSRIGKTAYVEIRPWIKFSKDEAKTWSKPVAVTDVPAAYFVVNNDRLVQLKSGRIIIPAALHPHTENGGMGKAIALFFLSDDGGKTWHRSEECVYPPKGTMSTGLQEPGVIELKDGRLLAWFRTGAGMQYRSYSSDCGETWTAAEPMRCFLCPTSPLSMKRHPETGDLYAVWNCWEPVFSVRYDSKKTWGRTPLVMARSQDEGKTWKDHLVLENEPDHGYAYIAMLFLENNELLLEYCCGGGKECSTMLQDSKIRTITLYGEKK